MAATPCATDFGLCFNALQEETTNERQRRFPSRDLREEDAFTLNSSVSNSAWTTKKPELLKSSLLPINQQLHGVEVWDETAIVNRGRELFERARLIWSAPGQG